MNAKANGNSTLHSLTVEQRTKLETWLFAENLTYREVADRCRTEFSVGVDLTTVGRYYRREKPRWDLNRTENAIRESLAEPGNQVTDPEARYRAVMVKLCEFVLAKAHDLESNANRRMVSEFIRVLISARRESNYAQRAVLAREKFEFDAATACLMNQIQVEATTKDDGLDDSQRIQKIREVMFGPNLPQ